MGKTALSTKPVERRHEARRVLPTLLLVAIAVAVLAGSALAANLVKNGSFEKDSNGDGIPNNWIDSSTGILPKRACNQSYAGACSLKVVFDGQTKIIRQNFLIGGNSGDSYKLTFWAKGKQVVTGAGIIQVGAIYFHHIDSSENSNSVSLAEGTSGWTKLSVTATASEDFDYLYVAFILNPDSGKAWFDKVKLVPSP
jgi:hypothetical protein